MFALMLFMFFFFLGFVAMFFYLLKRMDEQARTLGDEHAQLRVLLRAMESRIEKIAHMERLTAMYEQKLEADGLGQPMPEDGQDVAAHDPLLHLSFEEPHNPEENMGRKLNLTPPQKNWDLVNMP